MTCRLSPLCPEAWYLSLADGFLHCGEGSGLKVLTLKVSIYTLRCLFPASCLPCGASLLDCSSDLVTGTQTALQSPAGAKVGLSHQFDPSSSCHYHLSSKTEVFLLHFFHWLALMQHHYPEISVPCYCHSILHLNILRIIPTWVSLMIWTMSLTAKGRSPEVCVERTHPLS